MMCSVLRRPVKAVKGPSVTSASKNSRCSSSSQLRSRWVVDRGPDLLAEAGDRGLDRWGHAGGDGEPGPRRSGRRQSRRGVVGRVRPEDHQPVPVRAAGRGRGGHDREQRGRDGETGGTITPVASRTSRKSNITTLRTRTGEPG